MKNSAILLEVCHLTIAVKQGDAWLELVKDVSFTLCQGETLGIVGESGCGKSLTMQAIIRLLPQPDIVIRQGQILYRGIDILSLSSQQLNKIRGNKIAMIFQEPMTALNPVRTIQSQIGEQIQLHHPKLTAKVVKKQILELLNDVGIELAQQRQHNYPHQLSGGMRQRAMIAMALSCQPELIIADEPTTALDVSTQAQILRLLNSLKKKYNTSLVFISHDLSVIAQMCERALVMYAGRIIESASIEQLFHKPKHPYSQALLLCSPSKHHPCRQPLPSIQQTYNTNETEESQRQRFDRALLQYQLDAEAFKQHDTPVLAHTEMILKTKILNKHFELNAAIFSFHKNNFHALKNISFQLHKGQTLGIVGTSGSGKTTLAKIISGIIPASSGDILFEGKTVVNASTSKEKHRLAMAKNIQYIFQDPQESLNSRHTIQALLTEPLTIHKIGNTKSQIAAAKKMLLLVGLPDTILSRYPHEFSGGQKQRIGIARALILEPKLLICDEPVSALDVSVQAQILNLLVELQQRLQLSIIFITHDLAVVRHIADNIAVMHKGEIIEYGSALQVCDQPQKNYTQQLIAAIPSWPIKNNRLA